MVTKPNKFESGDQLIDLFSNFCREIEDNGYKVVPTQTALMSEIWKPIMGFEGLYEVAPCGAIRNARTLRWLSPSEKDDGYMSVKLFRDGVGRNKTVHRIVAEAFLPNPENKPQVNHKDRNKKNNDVSNLEWVTQAENQSHAIRNGTNKTRISKLKMTEKYHDKFYQMTCLFPPSLFDELDALSIKTGVSKSEMIREATMEYVNRRMAEGGETVPGNSGELED